MLTCPKDKVVVTSVPILSLDGCGEFGVYHLHYKSQKGVAPFACIMEFHKFISEKSVKNQGIYLFR